MSLLSQSATRLPQARDRAGIANAIRSVLSARHLYAAVLACAWFLLVLRTGTSQDPIGIDSSWSLVLAWAFEHELQWGSDLQFTYGPLGFLHPLAGYFPDTYALHFTAQLAITAAQALIFARVAMLLPAGVSLLFFGTMMYWSHFLWADSAVFACVAMILVLASGWLASGEHRLRTPLGALLLLLGAVFAWTKFTWLVLWIGAIAVLALRVRLGAGLRRALGVVALAACLALLVWFAAGQSLHALLRYVAASSDISSGYLSAMSAPPAKPSIEILGVCAAAAYLLLLALLWWHDRRNVAAAALLGFNGFALFLIWHATYTRADGHVDLLFPTLALLPFVLLADRNLRTSRATTIAAAACSLGITIAGAFVVNFSPSNALGNVMAMARANAGILAHPVDRQGFLDSIWQNYAIKHDLPRIRARVADRTVDLLTTSQGMLLLNRLNYAPRPVMQSYAAYTEKLDRENEAYFLGDRAPDFVLLKLDPIDQRFPAEEDSLALIALLRRYRPVLSEAGYLLLERTAVHPQAAPDPATLAAIDGRLGDYLDVPDPGDGTLICYADVDLSWLGRLYRFVFREPVLLMDLETTAGQHEFRFVPGIGRAGFLLSPALVNDEAYMKTTLGNSPPRARRLRLRAAAAWQGLLFEPRTRIRLAVGAAFPVHEKFEDASQFAYPNFNLAPAVAHGTTNKIVEDGHEALFMHAPATLEFALPPGKYALTGLFGITASAYTQASCPGADGIDLQVAVTDGVTDHTIARSHIDPFRNLRDRGDQRLNLEPIRIAAGQHLEISVLPARNTVCDWGYVRDIHIGPSPH
jgi:hypothetical protein